MPENDTSHITPPKSVSTVLTFGTFGELINVKISCRSMEFFVVVRLVLKNRMFDIVLTTELKDVALARENRYYIVIRR